MDKKMSFGSIDDTTVSDTPKNPAQRGKDWRKNVEMLSGKKKKAKNVLTRMEAYAERGGPFSMLSRCVTEKLKIKVWTRSYKHVRGICTGYLVAYDRHMNLAMYDVDEVYKNPVPPPSEKKKPRKRIRKKKLHTTTVKAETKDDREEHQVNLHMDITSSSVISTTEPVIKREIHKRNETSTAENSNARSLIDSSRYNCEINLEPLDLSVDRSVEEETVCSADNLSSKTNLLSNCRDFILNSEASGSNINDENKSLQSDSSAVDFKALFHGETGKDTNFVMKRMEGLSCSEALTSYSNSSISACASVKSEVGSASAFIPSTCRSDSSVTCITSCAVTTLNECVNSLATSIFTSSHTPGSKDLTVLSHIPGSICSTSSVLSADNKNVVTSLDISHPASKTRELSVLQDNIVSVKTGEVLSSDVMLNEISETREGSKTRSSNKDEQIKQESNVQDDIDGVDDTSDVEELMDEMKNIRAALEALDSSFDSNDDFKDEFNDDDSNYDDDFNYDDENYSDNCSASDNDSYDLYNQFHDNIDQDSENDNNNNDNERRESSYSNRDSSSFNQQPGPSLCTSGKNSSIEEKLVALASNQRTGNFDAASFSGKSSEQAKDRKKQSATKGSAATSDEKDSELRKDNPHALSISSKSSEKSKSRKKHSATYSDKKDLELQKDVDTEAEEGEIEDTECEEGEIVSEEETEEIKEDKSRIAPSGKNVTHENTGASDSRKHIDNNKARNDRQLKKDTSRVQELRQDQCDRKRTKSSVDYNRNSKVLPDGQGSTRKQSGVKDARDRNQSGKESQKFDCDQLGRRSNSTSRRNEIRGNTSKIDDTNMNRNKNFRDNARQTDETNFRSSLSKDRSSTITSASLEDRLRSDPINKRSVRRNEERYEAVLTRHVNQLFIRGDNVVMVAVASITD